MASGEKPTEEGHPPLPNYTTEKLGQMMLDMNIRYAGHDKKLMSHQFELEAFARRQEATNKKIEDSLALLIEASLHRSKEPPDPAGATPTSRGWKLPPSIVLPPKGVEPEALPRIKPEPPRFNGENAADWIRKIQKYYNHHYTPLHDRIYLTTYLFDHPASSWMTYWEENCKNKSWDEFLLSVKHRFDPDLYVDYVGSLATLRQTSTVEAYQTAFEDIMQKAPNVGDETLMSLFIAGLQDPIRQELLTKRPISLNEAFALAQQLTACHTLTAAKPAYTKPAWTDRDNRPKSNAPPALTVTAPH